MVQPLNRIRATRSQLKILYDKLGWEWDLSDSEDDDDTADMPYWKRRKLAADGFMPFSQHDFLMQEQEYKNRRKSKLEKKKNSEQKTHLIKQMKARRVSVGDENIEKIRTFVEEQDEEEAGPQLFGAPDSPEDEEGMDGEKDSTSAFRPKFSWTKALAAVSALVRMSKEFSKEDLEMRRTSILKLQSNKRSSVVSRPRSSIVEHQSQGSAVQRSIPTVPEGGSIFQADDEKPLSQGRQRSSITSGPVDGTGTVATSKMRGSLAVDDAGDVATRSANRVSMTSDAVSASISAARAILTPPETPCWRRARREEELERRTVELERLMKQRETFETQLQHCVECFIDLLPHTGALGDLRNRLGDTLATLREIAEDPDVAQEQELNCEIERICETLQHLIEEAIDCGDTVQPIAASMIHSVKFSDLRSLFIEVLQNESEMRQSLKALRGNQRRALVAESMQSARRCSAPGCDMNESSEKGELTLLHSPSTSEQLSESLRLPTRLVGQSSIGSHAKKLVQKKVDFGFRPDGDGEDSLENWSLFKVSKGAFSSTSSGSGFGDTLSTGIGLTTSSGFPNEKALRTETKVHRNRASFDCDFHEYMAQSRQMNEAAWQSASAPSLHPPERSAQEKKKLCPNLPKLIGMARSSSGTSDAAAFKLNLGQAKSHVSFKMRGEAQGGWSHCPDKVNIPSKKFSTTASSNALFAKW
jgi:hypothetical protein